MDLQILAHLEEFIDKFIKLSKKIKIINKYKSKSKINDLLTKIKLFIY